MEGNGGSASYSLKEMISTLMIKLEKMDQKLDDLKDQKADKLNVDKLESRVLLLEQDNYENKGIASFKKWIIPIVVSIGTAILSTYLFIHWSTGKI